MDLRSSAHKFLCDIVGNFRRFFAARIPFNAHRCQPLSRGINTAVYFCIICIFNMTQSAGAASICFDIHYVMCSFAIPAKRVARNDPGLYVSLAAILNLTKKV